MLTNVDRVKRALTVINGNRVFNTRAVYDLLYTGTEDELSPKQVGEAIRAVPYVENLGNGKYRIKGRKV